MLKTLLHGEKVPKLASRALAGPNSQVGARQLRSWRAKSGLGAPKLSSWRAKTVKLARAKCPPTDMGRMLGSNPRNWFLPSPEFVVDSLSTVAKNMLDSTILVFSVNDGRF